jgi:hypothetical protein
LNPPAAAEDVGEGKLLVAPGAASCSHQILLLLVNCQHRGAGIMSLWHMHGDQPVCLVGDGPHIRRVVL